MKCSKVKRTNGARWRHRDLVDQFAPPTRRSPLAEGRTGLPNSSVAIEHHWFALLYCISFRSLYSCSVPIVVSDQSQFLCSQSIIHFISYNHRLICFVILFICDYFRATIIHYHYSECISFAAITCHLISSCVCHVHFQ